MRWSLRTRLVVSSVVLIGVVCAVIGWVTAIALHSYLQGQVDDDLRTAVVGAQGGPNRDGANRSDMNFVARPGQLVNTVGARLSPGGGITDARKLNDTAPGPTFNPSEQLDDLTGAQREALGSVPLDGGVHTLDLPGLGSYRAQASQDGRLLLAYPLYEVEDTVNALVLVEVCVAGAGLVAAAIAGAATVTVALRPLRRVAATAARVSELPLHSGEVALHERVPESEADPRTEVGQVGSALNRMLGHVGSALAARQESETRVRQFVADASHELRTPLASIRGYAELTRRGREEIGPETQYALGRVESEAARMTGLVEDLLLLARLDAGRPLARAEVDLSPLVVDAVSDARAAGPDHTWWLELPDEPAAVYGDDARLRQVLVNLLANARTHTPPGTTVTARVRRKAPYTPYVSLEVQDDGPGIPPDLLPHVFERFARGDASRSRAAGSTGLGLAIVAAVVAAHGGQVTVDSVPGRTVFAVHLPGQLPAHLPATHSQPGHRLTTRP
ncbi:cell wall metabolism sensor histidine kinase WalK [Streptomyces sp. XD-27]|uniref:sensor histidine kinase n=1 Tax=Streptomyces sp. XD-27 TaxID=3062779 RepID=UPI0026F467F1|nr:HAMP domain-containing sensor histidine kinase [Streptomyces sp. XD-27]WKX74242.1 HAMP domain-containing sensor histidine kinase [Streptomyces sp. XD-27]